ncbi:MAG: phosphatase PAP2 family protein [Jatrophihabitantaceae bacterium]
MQTVALSWQHAGELSGLLAVGSLALRATPNRHARAVAPFAFEAAILALLYALWQLAGRLSVHGTSDALQRAQWIKRAEGDLRLPSERTVQNLFLGHPLLVQGANLYYAAMHFTIMFVFLIWLFVTHREHYRPVRATMAWTTLVCLLIQLVPVAPPRMLRGFVDTGLVYGQSVYSNGYAADQLSAMPSVHVAWAMVVGWYAVKIGTSRWRWIAPVHTVLTVLFVVVTANHWWLDGIVATSVLVICAWARYGASQVLRSALIRWRRRDPVVEAQPEPALS